MKNNIMTTYNKRLTQIKTLVELFDLAVEFFPENDALLGNKNNLLSYEELSDKVDRMSTCLQSKGITKGSKVFLVLEKSEFMIVAILATLKLGAVYIPLDPKGPAESLRLIMEEIKPQVVILDMIYLPKISDNSVQLLFSDIDLSSFKPIKNYPLISAENDAYIIYTSGSSGKRKGVLIQHKSILNTLKWRIPFYEIGPNDNVLQIPSYAFDSSVIDIFSCIGSGGKLVLLDDKRKTDMEYFISRLISCKITHFLITPSFYQQVLPYLKNDLSLRTITLAGEATNVELKNIHFSKHPNIVLINEYGPTENAVCSTVKRLMPADQEITIGKPIPGVEVCILNKDLTPIQASEKGEIHLAGIGLAREYFNQMELTASKFISINQKRWYKTGDIGTWNADREILYFGRSDKQVQVNGYRVELSEIEYQIQQLNIADRVEILAQKNAIEMWEIIVFYTGNTEVDPVKTKDKLLMHLPKYMLPNQYIKVDLFPLTQNGKLDEKKLWQFYEKSKLNANPKDEEIVCSETEAILLQIVKKIINNDRIDLNTDFFSVGLNSLNSIKLINDIYKEFGLKLMIIDLYNNPNIKKLSSELNTYA